MTTAPDRYIVNPGRKSPVSGLKAACSTDSAIVTETVLKVLADGGNAVDAAIAGVLVQAAVGVTTRVTPVYDFHMGSFAVCFRDPKSGMLGTTADPRRCGVADGLR